MKLSESSEKLKRSEMALFWLMKRELKMKMSAMKRKYQ